MSNEKPHWILRTHDGVPVPPSWAKGYLVKFRSGYIYCSRLIGTDGWRWPIEGDDSDIIAIRWLP